MEKLEEIRNLNTGHMKRCGFHMAKLQIDTQWRTVFVKEGSDDVFIHEMRGGSFFYYGDEIGVMKTTLLKVYPLNSYPSKVVTFNDLVPL